MEKRMALSKGIGTIKVNQQPDGTFKATATGVEDVTAATERGAILAINEAIRSAVEGDERKAPFRILQ
jgi:hypothetical protein